MPNTEMIAKDGHSAAVPEPRVVGGYVIEESADARDVSLLHRSYQTHSLTDEI